MTRCTNDCRACWRAAADHTVRAKARLDRRVHAVPPKTSLGVRDKRVARLSSGEFTITNITRIR
jgi:hypothetical protein